MSTVGRDRVNSLWQIVSGRQHPSSFRDEMYIRLKNRVFKIELARDGLPQSAIPDELVESYISQEVMTDATQRFDAGIETNRNRALGSAIIRRIKSLHSEPQDSLTYEHLLVERIADPGHNIILVGDTGSGKTHKLEYVWRHYISPLRIIEEETRRVTDGRLRVRIGVDEEDISSRYDLYRRTFTRVVHGLQYWTGAHFKRLYRDFVAQVFHSRDGGASIPYLASMCRYGLVNLDPPSLHTLDDRTPKESKRDLLELVLHFGGWIRDKHCANDYLSIFVMFDNIDASPRDVQEAIQTLLLDARPSRDALVVCACRPETAVNWGHRRGVTEIIPHIGPSAHDVVLHRLSEFLSSPPGENDLADLLQNMVSAAAFLGNLRVLRDRLETPHFKRFFDDLFGWQVRDALVFSQGLIDIAASAEPIDLVAGVTRSDFSLERRLYRPWGISGPRSYIVNIFDIGAEYEQRLAAYRILVYLHPEHDEQVTIQKVCEHMALFGYHPDDVLTVLQTMLRRGLVVTATRDTYTLGSYDQVHREGIMLTQTGHGLWKHGLEFSYVSSMMYYTKCAGRYYEGLETEEPSGWQTLRIARGFLKETADLELEELKLLRQPADVKSYLGVYGNTAISAALYENATIAAARMAVAEVRRRVPGSERMVDAALGFGDDLLRFHDSVESAVGLTVDEPSQEFADAVTALSGLDAREDGLKGC